MQVFADTFYFIALLNANDTAHDRVAQRSEQQERELVTTRWVLAEVADALNAPVWRESVVILFDRLARQSDVLIFMESDQLFERGLDLDRWRPDKYWSLTDCISFVVMKQERLREALSHNHHFEQAGFVPLFAY